MFDKTRLIDHTYYYRKGVVDSSKLKNTPFFEAGKVFKPLLVECEFYVIEDKLIGKKIFENEAFNAKKDKKDIVPKLVSGLRPFLQFGGSRLNDLFM